MADDCAPVTPTATADRTTAGNYFVSNYPPYSVWSPTRVPEAHAALRRPPVAGTDLGLYVHIPFCRKRCHFCYFKVYTDKKQDEIGAYVEAVIREIGLHAALPAAAGRHPRFVYFGGGTPSFLSVEQLLHLTAAMKAAIPWDRAEEVTFECEPGTLTDRKIHAIREMGVTRISLGVENFSDKLLELNGRAHLGKQILRAFEYARALEFPQVNIDLIAGMMGETDDNWRENVRRTIDLGPDSVTIYQMEIPYNTTIYKGMKESGERIAPVADWSTKRGWVAHAFAELERAGYHVASAYTAVKDKRTSFIYRDSLWRGADLIGLGVSSFSHVAGTHFQNDHDFAPYVQRVERGELPLWRAYTPTAEERLIREFILQLKLGRLDLAYFVRKFGVDPRERFAAQLADLAAQGLAQITGDELRLTRAALLEVDRLLHAFFLPAHRNIRPT